MIYWNAICSFCLVAPLIYTLPSLQATPKASSPSFAALPVIDPDQAQQGNNSLDVTRQGNASVQRLDWRGAQQDFQEALRLWPGNMEALYGLAKCSQTAGDSAKAIEYYRKAVYSANSADKGFRETDTSRLMEFAILLNKTGQTAEAIRCYNHAASLLDFEDSENHGGKPALKVLFPEIVSGDALPEQVSYTPERLQALADSLLAYKQQGFWSDKEVLAHAQEAAKLYPDSAVTHYYLGEVLPQSNPDKKAAYQKAAELGNDATIAAAKERLGVSR